MPWVRLDDTFADHPKVAGLTATQFRTWVETLCYCARHRTDGKVPAGAAVAGLDRNRERFRELRLLDHRRGVDWVHDWLIYNGDVGKRVAAYLRKRPAASANEVFQAIGGRRADVLNAVKAAKPGGTQKYPRRVSEYRSPPATAATEPKPAGTKSVRSPTPEVLKGRRARARARAKSLPEDLKHELDKLMPALRDVDAGSRRVIEAAAAGLPLASIARVRESAVLNGPVGVGYVVNALKSEQAER